MLPQLVCSHELNFTHKETHLALGMSCIITHACSVFFSTQLHHKLRKSESSPETSRAIYRENQAQEKQHPKRPRTASLFRREVQSRPVLLHRSETQQSLLLNKKVCINTCNLIANILCYPKLVGTCWIDHILAL